VIVADTNILVYLFAPSERTALAERALKRDQIWAAPRLWRSEYRNVLATYIRKGIITLDDGLLIMKKSLRFMQGLEYEVDSEIVLALAAMSKCSAYDCEFIALAEKLDVPLVTVDRQILAQFPERAVALEVFAAS
jgi:predicted nucleic acid-binding protein